MIAYQRFGSGDRTIVWSSPPLVSIETRWLRPGAARLWEFLSTIGTVVIFDFRGIGSSERLPRDRVGCLEEMCFDLGAVVTGFAGSTNALVGTGTATMAVVTYAVDHPETLDHLVLLNATADHPRRKEADAAVREIAEHWGTGEALARAAKIELEASERWESGRGERSVATPDIAAAWTRRLLEQDVSGSLAGVRIPTLVIHTGDLAYITPEMSERVATAIPEASYLARPSSFFNWGEWGRDIQEFLTGSSEALGGHRDLTTVVFSDVVDSTAMAASTGDDAWRETLGQLDGVVDRAVTSCGGRVIKQTGDGHLMEFSRPGQALKAASRLVDDVRHIGVDIRVGIHFGEVERRPDGDIGGIAVHLAARIAANAQAGEVCVSRTVAELTAGDGRTFVDRGTPELKGIPGEWPLLALQRP